ncbi:MAG: VanW family protein [Clostridia bacterium]|nr:VanW family protein [Clostridia bacterium]
MREILKCIAVFVVVTTFFSILTLFEVQADTTVNIVLKYEDTTYSTQVYGPEIQNIESGMSIATTNWINEISNHVNSMTFGKVTINSTLLKQDVFAAIKAGSGLVSLDLKDYIKGAEKVNQAVIATTAIPQNQQPAAIPNVPAILPSTLTDLGINTKISECSTKYKVKQDRTQNVIVAASRINGLIVQPGATVSFDAAILPRTVANGYGMGNAIMGDDFIKVVGGGICQVSSTLNTAVLRAGIIPTERHNHSQNVAYLASGLDATISSGKLDYKFTNPYAYPIYIAASTVDGVLTVALYSNDKALNGMSYTVTVSGPKKKNTTYINCFMNGVMVGSVPAYSSRYK